MKHYLALAFIAFLTIFEAILFWPIPATRIAFTIYEPYPRDTLHLLAIALALVMAVVYIRLSFEAGAWGRLAYGLLFSFALFVEYNYRGVFQRFATAQDFIIALTPLDIEIGHDAIAAYNNPWSLFPIITYALLLGWLPRPSRPTMRLHLLGGGLLMGGFLGLSILTTSWYPTVSLSAFFRTLTDTTWQIATQYDGPRQAVPTQTTTRPTTNIIFIVDESVRADHLSLNGYGRPTTPYLEALAAQGWLINWGVAEAGGSCSLTSNNQLLTGRIEADELRYAPTLFQYAQAMGYRTYHLNATSNQFWLGTAADVDSVDVWWPRDHFVTAHPYDRDVRLAEMTHDLVSHETGLFIWINKRGVHFDYNSHYPPIAAQWQPTSAPQLTAATLTNAYDNALRYNLDSFFARLLGSEATFLEHTIILYTADHGQTLREHGETWTHCVGTPNELAVPLFLLTWQPFTPRLDSPAHHQQLFATLLDVMDVPPAQRLYPYAPSLLKSP